MKPKYDFYDVVIVGTGVSGALIACKLSEAGRRVLLLDAGSVPKDRKDYVKSFAEAPQKERIISRPYVKSGDDADKFAPSADGDDLKLNKEIPFGPNKYYDQPGPSAFKSSYLRLIGGSTWAWRGNSPRFIPDDFKLKTKFPKLAEKYPDVADWSISYDDIEPYFSEAEQEIGVAADHDEWNNLFGAYRSKPFPMKKIAQAYGDLQLIKAFADAPEEKKFFEGKEIKFFGLPQARNSERYQDRPPCEGNNNCIPLCPIQAKYDATVHLKKAAANGAETIEKAVVTRLEAGENGNIAKVWYKTWGEKNEDFGEHFISGKIVVLAAHAIETPKILLMSDGIAPIAKQNEIVGAYLMDHLGGEGAAIMPFPVFPFRGPQSTSCIESFRNHEQRDVKCVFRLTIGNDGWGRGKHPYATLEDLLKRKLFGEELKKELHHIVTHQLRIAYASEQLPNKKNRVRLADEKDELGIPKPKIEFTVDDYSLEGMKMAQEVIKHIFRTVGAAETEWEFSNLTDAKNYVYSGSAHIMGTCRMGDTPETSVVDADCRSHEHKNLFIVDGSVFTTGAPTNPTIVTAALALLAADKMIIDLKG